MSRYQVAFEISGPTAMWTRPDTGAAPVSYPASTFSAAKGIFESSPWLKSAEVVPTEVEICARLVWHPYTTNYGGRCARVASFQEFWHERRIDRTTCLSITRIRFRVRRNRHTGGNGWQSI
jgi:CRISPR-associated Cas5-like protein